VTDRPARKPTALRNVHGASRSIEAPERTAQREVYDSWE
jgi:hypothetical protein